MNHSPDVSIAYDLGEIEIFGKSEQHEGLGYCVGPCKMGYDLDLDSVNVDLDRTRSRSIFSSFNSEEIQVNVCHWSITDFTHWLNYHLFTSAEE